MTNLGDWTVSGKRVNPAVFQSISQQNLFLLLSLDLRLSALVRSGYSGGLFCFSLARQPSQGVRSDVENLFDLGFWRCREACLCANEADRSQINEVVCKGTQFSIRTAYFRDMSSLSELRNPKRGKYPNCLASSAIIFSLFSFLQMEAQSMDRTCLGQFQSAYTINELWTTLDPRLRF